MIYQNKYITLNTFILNKKINFFYKIISKTYNNGNDKSKENIKDSFYFILSIEKRIL
jgi:hypothetical protein